MEQGKASQALAYLDKALEFDPDHEQALLNSAILLQELGRAELRKVARERLLKLLHKVVYSCGSFFCKIITRLHIVENIPTYISVVLSYNTTAVINLLKTITNVNHQRRIWGESAAVYSI